MILNVMIFLPITFDECQSSRIIMISFNNFSKGDTLEAVARRFSVKKVFLEISQNSQENTPVSESLSF